MVEKTKLRQWVNKIPMLELKELVYVLSEYMLDIDELKMSPNGPFWPGTGETLFDNNNNNEDLISFKTAKLANEKGFNVWCSSAYCHLEFLGMATEIEYNTFIKDTYPAPTQSILQKWLRENYNIHVEVIWIDTLSDLYVYHISTTGNGIRPDSQHYNSYIEALEYGLFEALKSIK